MPTLAGNKHLSVFFFSQTAFFPCFDGKDDGSNPSEMDNKVVIPAPTQ